MKTSVMVAGLAFGDEGKGTMTDYFVRDRKATLTVRYNGGPQAAHNVVEFVVAGDRHHTFAQFGSGTFAGAHTHLSRFCLFEPFALEHEAEALWDKGIANPMALISVDPHCTIITPYHWLANQLRELLRGEGRHGSTGFGVGAARQDELDGVHLQVVDVLAGVTLDRLRIIRHRMFGEFSNIACDPYGYPPESARKIQEIHQKLRGVDIVELAQQYREIIGSLNIFSTQGELECHESVVFEGAQGVLLDETYGFAPYNTWTDTTFRNADTLVEESGGALNNEKVGVLRTYFTRHGAGPFPTEDTALNLEEKYNKPHDWSGPFRLGYLDMNMLRYAVSVVGGLDTIALTHYDFSPAKIAVAYEGVDPVAACCTGIGPTESIQQVRPIYVAVEKLNQLVSLVEEHSQRSVKYVSFGPTAGDKRNMWHPSEIYYASVNTKSLPAS